MNNHHDIHNFSCKSNKTGFSLFILGPEHIFNLSSRTLLPSPSWSWSLWSVSAWWELAQWTSWKLGGGCRPAGSSCWLGPRPGIQSTTWTLVWPALSFSHHHSYQSIVFSQLHEHWCDQFSLSLIITAINQSIGGTTTPTQVTFRWLPPTYRHITSLHIFSWQLSPRIMWCTCKIIQWAQWISDLFQRKYEDASGFSFFPSR